MHKDDDKKKSHSGAIPMNTNGSYKETCGEAFWDAITDVIYLWALASWGVKSAFCFHQQEWLFNKQTNKRDMTV